MGIGGGGVGGMGGRGQEGLGGRAGDVAGAGAMTGEALGRFAPHARR